MVHPDDLERVAQEVSSYSGEEGRQEFSHRPYRIVTKDKEVRWLDDRTFIRRNEKGGYYALPGYCIGHYRTREGR